MGKLVFLQDGYVDGVHEFKKGKVYEVSEDSGSYDRWIRRGVAAKFEEKQDLAVELPEKKDETVPVVEHGKKNKKHKVHGSHDPI